MPYIKQQQRDGLDSEINALLYAIRGMVKKDDTKDMVGILNYCITRLLVETLMRDSISYEKINRINGLLADMQQEIYRRIAASYEDLKIKQNGDLDCFQKFTAQK